MPSLIRLIISLLFLAGLGYGAMLALVMFVDPGEKEITTRIPAQVLFESSGGAAGTAGAASSSNLGSDPLGLTAPAEPVTETQPEAPSADPGATPAPELQPEPQPEAAAAPGEDPAPAATIDSPSITVLDQPE